MVEPPVAGEIIPTALVHTAILGNRVGKSAQHLLAHAKRHSEDEHPVPQNQIVGNSLIEIGKVLEPTLEPVAAREQLDRLARIILRRCRKDSGGDGQPHARQDKRQVHRIGVHNEENRREHKNDTGAAHRGLKRRRHKIDQVATLEFGGHLALERIKALPGVLKVFERTELHLLAVLGIGTKIHIDDGHVDGILDTLARDEPQRILLDGLFSQAQETALGARFVHDFDHAIVRELHERGDKGAVFHRPSVHQRREHGRMVTGGHIAKVGLINNGLGACIPSPAQPHRDHKQHCGEHREGDRPHRGDDAGAGALGVGLLRPLGLLGKDRVETRLARRSKTRHPIRRERHADLSELPRVHRRRRKRHNGIGRIGRVQQHAAVKRPVAPGAKVRILGLGVRQRAEFGAGKRHVQMDVLGVLLPVRANELPVQLRGIGPRHDRALDHIRDPHGHLVAVDARNEDLEVQRRALICHRVNMLVARLCVLDLRHRTGICEGLLRAVGRSVDRTVALTHAQNRHRRRISLLVLGERDAPIHAVDRILKGKRACLGHEQVAVLHHPRLDIHAWERIRVGTGRSGHGKERQRKRAHCENHAALVLGLGTRNGRVYGCQTGMNPDNSTRPKPAARAD